MAGNGELFPVIKDLKNTIAEIHREYRDKSLPVTDGSPQLHRLCARLEQLLQFDQKERRNLIGNRKDYWDFFCHSLSEMKGGPEGIAFVGSIPELRTPTGRGRAFIRYCLVHQQLADSLQICFMEPKKAREWYYSRNPFLTEGLCSGILAQLYELNTVTFNLSLKRTDLDAAWPLVTGDSYKQSTQRILNHDGENQISENEPLHINVDINRKTVTTQEEKILAYGHSEQQSTRGQKTSEAASGTERIEARAYEAKISSLERQNMELMNKLDTLLKEVSHRKAVGHCGRRPES
ncbi:FYVE and coiled-coil domain-containing protein 1-like isoform X1 [Rhinatrema bivittatum]|uniref:FYVE and coiled-coil domain-containing protein 1-like isoform X1 n=1 Tax=Rhinatrema bivittatum TaxID=194408 RepID=UPI00112DF9B4|nr:FYVE and coiled-coil domain-containing protein 1-like isoform X1 [Rhinatrema bivittatum]XP_029460960.1 FYVE and coiled-coil domain-containing protein 1-like isoform X1 [Rhinatrema bivittatum]XP_029460961.1 FYVE and coiled-coil domain-containing protein 1-like isoform X1 [Rhinatrema bivittatum]